MTNIEVVEKVISERRSVKPQSFNGKKIKKEAIEQLLALADWAPTHGYTEPWRFIVMANDGVKRFCRDHAEMYKNNTPEERFINATYEKFYHQGDRASHVIVAFSKRGEKPNITVQEEICATACAIQNLLLAAEAMDIAAFWSTGGQTFKPAMKAYFNLQEEDTMLGVLYLGYTDESDIAGRRITPMEEKVMWYNS